MWIFLEIWKDKLILLYTNWIMTLEHQLFRSVKILELSFLRVWNVHLYQWIRRQSMNKYILKRQKSLNINLFDKAGQFRSTLLIRWTVKWREITKRDSWIQSHLLVGQIIITLSDNLIKKWIWVCCCCCCCCCCYVVVVVAAAAAAAIFVVQQLQQQQIQI